MDVSPVHIDSQTFQVGPTALHNSTYGGQYCFPMVLTLQSLVTMFFQSLCRLCTVYTTAATTRPQDLSAPGLGTLVETQEH